MIELVDVEECGGSNVVRVDFGVRLVVLPPPKQAENTDARVEARSRWNEIGRRLPLDELAEVMRLVDAWEIAHHRAAR
jgi:hypothetical protein